MNEHAWWQRGVVYQVYPRSFQDSDGDGVGDINGVRRRLDYLSWLGVDAVWLSPIFPSPMADFGYDISNYCGIDPVFGTLADFDRLLEEAHGRGLRVILDFVPNHTSDQHPWFTASRSSRSNPKRNWYVWRDPAPDGGQPCNWLSEFGGSAWEYDPTTGQYYYHAYLKEQPDLNWRNADVRAAMHDVMRFWLARGVDGFRVDAIHMLVEADQPVDNPPNPAWRPGMPPHRRLLRTHTADLPETHTMVAGMRRVANEFQGRVLIGEAYLPIDRLMLYYGEELQGFHLPFNFHLLSTPWRAPALAELVRQYEAALPGGGWPNWVLGNHDRSRVATRLGGLPQARQAAMLLLTLRGTPTIYQGDEIGMTDVPVPPERVRDPWEKNLPEMGLGRDPVRTPMQWSMEPGGGFTTGDPWLPVGDLRTLNVDEQGRDPASMLTLYRELLQLRRLQPTLEVGSYREIESGSERFLFERAHRGDRILAVFNIADRPSAVTLPTRARVLLSTHLDRPAEAPAVDELLLRPFEGIVAKPE